jgi:hypothetical protein
MLCYQTRTSHTNQSAQADFVAAGPLEAVRGTAVANSFAGALLPARAATEWHRTARMDAIRKPKARHVSIG